MMSEADPWALHARMHTLCTHAKARGGLKRQAVASTLGVTSLILYEELWASLLQGPFPASSP